MCANATVRPGDAVVVLGPGPIGLLCARMAALSGADPLIVAGLYADAPRFEVARQLGATHTVDVEHEHLVEIVRDLTPLGADVVCDASGASETLQTALHIARPDGHIVKVGWSPDLIATDVNPVVHKNVRVQGSFSHNFAIWERVIHLLNRGVTRAELLVQKRARLPGWRAAFDAMHHRQVIKSVLLPE
jgi:alcohol dehydrogenase/L-iditol 2-dehydrogenase